MAQLSTHSGLCSLVFMLLVRLLCGGPLIKIFASPRVRSDSVNPAVERPFYIPVVQRTYNLAVIRCIVLTSRLHLKRLNGRLIRQEFYNVLARHGLCEFYGNK